MIITKNDLRTLAVELFDIGVVKTGTFRTPIYVDFKQLLAHPKLLARLSTMLWLLTDVNEQYDRVCGAPFNALSRCGIPYRAITYAYQISTQTNVPMLMRRRNMITNSNVIEGQFEVGDRVVIVDDEISNNGNNILEIAVDLVKEKLKIGKALVVIDREQAGLDNLKNAGITVKSLFKITELIEYLRDAGKIPTYGRQIPRNRNDVIESFAKEMPVSTNDRNSRRRGVI